MKTKPTKKTQEGQIHSNKTSASPPKPSKWGEMNRKQRREMMCKIQSDDLSLEVVHPRQTPHLPLCAAGFVICETIAASRQPGGHA
jgi:hypothetical protein